MDNQEHIQLMEKMPNPALLVDPNGVIVGTNQALRFFLGYDENEMEGQKVEILIDPAVRERHVQFREQYLENPKPIMMGQGRKFKVLAKSGEFYPTEVGLYPLELDGQTHVQASLMDLRAYEAGDQSHSTQECSFYKLKHLTQKVRFMEEEARGFFLNLGPTLQEQVWEVKRSAIPMKKRLLEIDDEALTQAFTEWKKQCDRMQRLVGGVIEYSVLSTKSLHLNREDLGQIVQEAVQDLEAIIRESLAQVVVGQMESIVCDREMIGQLFRLLILNSIKFAKPDTTPKIDVVANPQQEMCEIHFQDNGIGIEGISDEELFCLFRKKTQDPNLEGEGVGLAFCKKIVERHNGTISARSEPGQGIVITISLPYNQSTE
ncbi:MAG: Adaptive-response sensory-kinase SasA [Chlamydiia bacterium]|nr:Adaptive-response sensory-kinase SasA [Chlamydiia bacterium]